MTQAELAIAPSCEAKYLHDKLETIESFLSFCRGGSAPAWPLEVFLEVSNVCDLKCAMCTYFSAINPKRLMAMKQSARGFFDLDATGASIEEVLRHALLIHCYGFGEPTVHPQFREFLSYALEFEAMVDFFTNGMHLTDDLAAFLVDHRVFRIAVSFSGSTKQEYEAVYLGGQFERVLEGIRRVSDYKKAAGAEYPIIAINSIAFHHHVANLERFVDLMADHGANRVDLKQLIPYREIPELYSHASILRPWVEGEILARAERRAAARGIVLHAADYATNAVRTEEEYRARIEQWRDALSSTGRERFPEAGIEDFRVLAKSTVYDRPDLDRPSPAPAAVPRSGNALRLLHEIGSIPTAKDGRAFYCMEPFKTLYVRRSGEVKPCCFGHDDAALLGNVRETPATEVWRGPHFDTVRKAIVNGEYPRKLCGTCLMNGMSPASHEANYHVRRYEGWWRDRFGRAPLGEAGLTPWAEPFSELYDGDVVVNRLFEQGSPLVDVNGADELL
ncbi:MAG: radical SAM/SPASM domain-containing protein, partial [Candidatus Binatia bacterium]